VSLNRLVIRNLILFYFQAVKKRLTGPDFVWFIPGWFKDKWWTAVDGTECSAEQMEKSLDQTLGGRGNSVLDSNKSRLLVSNKV